MEFIKQNALMVMLAVSSGIMLLFDLLRERSGAGISAIQATLLMNRENAVVIDLREATEFAAGHIPNARNIPLAELAQRKDELNKFKKKPLVLVCKTGARSAKALAELSAAGFDKLHNLAGGIAAWSKDGHPVVKG